MRSETEEKGDWENFWTIDIPDARSTIPNFFWTTDLRPLCGWPPCHLRSLPALLLAYLSRASLPSWTSWFAISSSHRATTSVRSYESGSCEAFSRCISFLSAATGDRALLRSCRASSCASPSGLVGWTRCSTKWKILLLSLRFLCRLLKWPHCSRRSHCLAADLLRSLFRRLVQLMPLCPELGQLWMMGRRTRKFSPWKRSHSEFQLSAMQVQSGRS